MTRQGEVELPVEAEVAYAYFVDPRNRPQWQSSLRTVVISGEPTPEFGVGTRWVDVTRPGLRPRMETTVAVPGRRWAETGTWHGFAADLSLEFTPTDGGCRVRVEFEVRSPRWLPGLGALLAAAALPMVLADVERAGEIVARR